MKDQVESSFNFFLMEPPFKLIRCALLKTLYDSAYKKTKKEYGVTVKHNNEEIRKILDVCFEVIYAVVADKKGNIKYPGPGTA